MSAAIPRPSPLGDGTRGEGLAVTVQQSVSPLTLSLFRWPYPWPKQTPCLSNLLSCLSASVISAARHWLKPRFVRLRKAPVLKSASIRRGPGTGTQAMRRIRARWPRRSGTALISPIIAPGRCAAPISLITPTFLRSIMPTLVNLNGLRHQMHAQNWPSCWIWWGAVKGRGWLIPITEMLPVSSRLGPMLPRRQRTRQQAVEACLTAPLGTVEAPFPAQGALSSVGRASRLHREGRRFEPVSAHHGISCQSGSMPCRVFAARYSARARLTFLAPAA